MAAMDGQRFGYHRVGCDHRPVAFRDDGLFATGGAGSGQCMMDTHADRSVKPLQSVSDAVCAVVAGYREISHVGRSFVPLFTGRQAYMIRGGVRRGR